MKRQRLLCGAVCVCLILMLATTTAQAQVYKFVTKWGSGGSGDGQFVRPETAAVDSSGNVYVIESTNNRVQKFASDGTYITKWGSSGTGDGQFFSPHDIEVDGSDNVYVVDTDNARIQKFTSDGTFITKWGSFGVGDGQFQSAHGIAVDASDNVYVADSGNNRIQKFTSDGTFTTKWGSIGNSNGQLNLPTDVAVDSSGDVYVVDTNNNRIQKFTSDGTYITKWGTKGSGNGQLLWAYGIATDAADDVYVADSSNHRIQKFTSDGTYITHWGTFGPGDGQFNTPNGLGIDGANNVYVADTSNNRIQVFAPLSATIDSITPAPALRGQSVTFTGHGTDPQVGHTITTHSWWSSLDNEIGTTASFSTTTLSRGNHTISYRVQCSGGFWTDWVAWTGNPLVIQNNIPSVASVAITPDPAYANTNLTATPSGWADADSDPAGYNWQWEKDTGGGFAVIAGQTTSTLGNANFTGSDVVRVTCTPNDGLDTGTPVTDVITITNTAPTLTSVALTPDPAYTTNNLLATPSGWTDPDGDPAGYDWQWEIDTGGGFAVIAGQTTSTLGSANFAKSDVVRVTCTPNDGTDTGTPVTDVITITNTAPTLTSVALTPDPAYTTDDLLATPSGWTDPDGDPAGYNWQWEKDTGGGFAVIAGQTTATLGNANFTGSDVVRVTCTPNDGTDTGTPVTDVITITNTAPTLTSVALTPDPAYTTDDLLATPSGWADADSDPAGYNWQWEKDTGGGFAVIAGQTTSTLGNANFTGSDVVRVTCTPNDGLDTGTPVTDVITITNTAPTLTSVALTPDPAYTTNNLLATPSGWTDPDGDPAGYDWQWEIDTGGGFAVIAGQTTSTLGSANFAKSDVVRVTCTPNDGTDTGTPVTDVITITNTAPTLTSVALTPDPAYTTDDLLATPSGWTDPDGDPAGYNWQWEKDTGGGFAVIAGQTTATLGSANFARDDVVRVTCTPNDGTDTGTPVTDVITITNTAPTLTSVALTPDPAYTTNNLLATPSGWADADSDPEGYDWQWEIDTGGGFAVIGGETTDTLSSANFARDDVLRVTCTPNDGTDTGTPVTDVITITNTAPTVTSVALTPDPAYTTDDLLATPSGWADADSDPEGYDWQWEIDTGGGFAVIGGETTDTLSSANFARDDVVRVTCTPNDGTDTGTPVTDVITITNTAPTLASVALTPDPAYTTDDLLATPSGWADADGDPAGYDWQWEIDTGGGFAVIGGETTDTLSSANFARDDVLRVTCTPNDGTDTGTPVTDVITITNTAPTLTSVALTPDPAYTTDDLLATPSGWADADSDPEGYDWQWEIDTGGGFAVIGGETTDTLSSANFARDDVLRVTCTPNDGTDTGTPVTDVITITNTAPTLTSVALTPDPAYTTDDLLATPSGWADADSDPEGYDWQWEIDTGGGFAVIGGETTDTLSSANFARDDVVRVTCTPNDGTDTGTPVTDVITITNTAPTLASVALTPDPAYTTDDLLATPSGWADADGDPAGYDWQWEIDTGGGFAVIGGETTDTLSSANFARDDVLRVTCTPNDGTDTGTPVTDVITITNTAPTVTSVALTPDPAYTTDDLLATPSGWADADSDPEGYDWQWEIDTGGGFAVIGGETTDTLGSANFIGRDVVRVTCTPNDGTDIGTPVTDVITITNTAPTTPTVVILPANPTTHDPLRATTSGSTDADGDPISYSYQWYKDGALQPSRIYQSLGARWTRDGETWRAVVTPTDSFDDGPTGEAVATVGSVISAPTVVITPEVPVNSDTLLANASGSADSDGDPITYTYQWFKDGVKQMGVTWRTIGAWRRQPGQVWRCVVTPTDGSNLGPASEDSVTLKTNTPPTAPTVVILPANPTAHDPLRATTSGSTDADGDTISYSYQWYKDGALQPSRIYQTVGARWTRDGETWRCVVTPNDGFDDGPTGEAVATVGSIISAPTVVITPEVPVNSDTLLANASGSTDSDGDPISYTYQWFKDGVEQEGMTWRTIGAWRRQPGQTWRCVVTPTDGSNLGPASEDSVTLKANTPPTAPTVTILPAAPTTKVSLRATTSGSTDADGDTISYSYQWYKDGALQPGRIYQTVAARWTRDGETWRCVVTPNDGFDNGPTGEGTETVGSIISAPTVVITPEVPVNSDTLLAKASGSTDSDGDPISYTYQWFKDGVEQVGVTWRKVGAWRRQPGQTWRCVATPTDGTNTGPTGEDSVTLEPNTPPTAPTVVMTPAAPTTADSFKASASGSTDADGDTITYTYQWYKDGVEQTGVTWRKIGAWRTREGQTWRCVVTPNDGFDDGPTGEATVVIAAQGAPLTVSGLAALPTARGAEIAFTLSADAAVTCEVLNIAGRAVKTIVADRPMAEGINSLAWDGSNASGLRAPAGVYLVRMTATTEEGLRSTSMGILRYLHR